MAVAMRRWYDEDLPVRHRDSSWGQNEWLDDWKDWPMDWPKPREMMGRFTRDTDQWWRDWPTDWPRMDAVMPRMTSQLDRIDRNWRKDPFWMDIYPRWAEPIFKDGIDVHSSITNDDRRFAVDIDCYQFKPEEIQVKTLDDTLVIEGRHEDVKDRDNFTKMYFIRKYQLPQDLELNQIASSIDNKGRLTVEAPRKAPLAINSRERVIPIEGVNGRRSASSTNTSPRGRHDSGYSNGYSSRGQTSPIHIQTGDDQRGREIRIDTNYGNGRVDNSRDYSSSRNDNRGDYREHLSPNSRDGYTTSHSYSYHRSESRSRLSPHDMAMSNENRAFANASPRRTSFDNRSADHQSGFRSQSRGPEIRVDTSRSESRNRDRDYHTNGYSTTDSRNGGYRVESPASTTTGILKNTSDLPPRAESRSESLRSVQILRKTFG
ncbi:unnamed protein product [Auanema sp. JU1783]|nr:unnamed protein product [Auanema sp. JU1783]